VVGILDFQLSAKDLVLLEKFLQPVNLVFISRNGNIFWTVEACDDEFAINFHVNLSQIRPEALMIDPHSHHSTPFVEELCGNNASEVGNSPSGLLGQGPCTVCSANLA
jgi:hypothetical protein